MALQSSGTISLDDIRTELGLAQSNVSLGSMSDTAGFSAPDQISDFYGYSHSSLTSINSTARAANSADACDETTSLTLYHNGAGSNPTTGNTIYQDAAGTTVAVAGYYQNSVQDWFRVGSAGGVISVGFCF